MKKVESKGGRVASAVFMFGGNTPGAYIFRVESAGLGLSKTELNEEDTGFTELSRKANDVFDFRMYEQYASFKEGTYYEKSMEKSYQLLQQFKEAQQGQADEKDWSYLTVLITDGDSDDCTEEGSCKPPPGSNIDVSVLHIGHIGVEKQAYDKIARLSNCDGYEKRSDFVHSGVYNDGSECSYLKTYTYKYGHHKVAYNWVHGQVDNLTHGWIYESHRFCRANYFINDNLSVSAVPRIHIPSRVRARTCA